MMMLFVVAVNAQESQDRSGDDMPPPPPPEPAMEVITEDSMKKREEVFMIVEDMPEFPGGQEKMAEFIGNNLVYPKKAKRDNITGRVVVQFIVSETGQVEDVKVVKGVHPLLDSAAVQVVRSMPLWKPGKQRGKNVRVRYVLPIRFTLGEEPKKKRKR